MTASPQKCRKPSQIVTVCGKIGCLGDEASLLFGKSVVHEDPLSRLYRLTWVIRPVFVWPGWATLKRICRLERIRQFLMKAFAPPNATCQERLTNHYERAGRGRSMNSHDALFESDRKWIAGQPEFEAGWERGCEWIDDRVEREVKSSLISLGVKKPPDDSLVARCRAAVTAALLYFWRQAVVRAGHRGHLVAGAWVLETIQRGIRPTTPDEVETKPRSMGSNPLDDLVLAIAAAHRNETSLRCIYRDYRSVFDSEAARLRGSEPLLSEWEDLCSWLVLPRQHGDPSTAPLLQYRGYGSLRSWIRPVARHFLVDASRRLRTRRAAEEIYAEGAQHGVWMDQSAVDWDAVVSILRNSLAQLAPRDRQILAWEAAGFPNQAIAASLGVSPGQASRLRCRALQSLSTDFFRSVDASRAEAASEESPLREALGRASIQELAALLRSVATVIEQALPKARIKGSHAMSSAKTREDGNETEEIKGSRVGPRPMQDKKLGEGDEPLLRPKDVLVVNLAEEPEAVLAKALSANPEKRFLVICLDARTATDADVISKWLEQFDAILSEQVERATAETFSRENERGELIETLLEDPIADGRLSACEPRRAVLVACSVFDKTDPIWRERDDVTWVPSEVNASPPRAFDVLLDFMTRVMNHWLDPMPPTSEPFPSADSLRSVESRLTPEQAEEWRNKMEQLGEWPNRNATGTS